MEDIKLRSKKKVGGEVVRGMKKACNGETEKDFPDRLTNRVRF